jgi:hypothetical protein
MPVPYPDKKILDYFIPLQSMVIKRNRHVSSLPKMTEVNFQTIFKAFGLWWNFSKRTINPKIINKRPDRPFIPAA